MTRTVMIDLPSVVGIPGSGWELDVSRFTELLDALTGLKGVQIIFRPDMEQSHVSYEELWLLDYALSTKDTKPYSLDDLNRARYTTSSPVLTNAGFPSDLNDEIIVQVDTLHHSVNTLFLISSGRRGNSTADLRTTRDHSDKEHKTLTSDDKNIIANYVASTKPVLVQLKHDAKGYSKAGKYVSPFSSYDPRNEQPAKDLLERAYDDYSGEETDPQYLYTWDYNHNTYVQFRRSAEGKYHGMDFSDLKSVPEYIRDIYHH